MDHESPSASGRPATPIGLSLVVPVFNEVETIDLFLERVQPILTDLMRHRGGAFEIIFVDDGSSDGTFAKLQHVARDNAAIKVVGLSRNFGKDAALSAGLDHARGAAVIPVDVDLQDPPETIPALYAKWLEGYDAVFATRTDRSSDGFAKRFTAGAFYRVFNRIADTEIPENAGDFRLLDRSVVDALKQLPERNRFMKGMYAWVGFRQASVPMVREKRSAGSSKWPGWRLWRFALDGIIAFSTMPLRLWTYVGAFIAAADMLYALFLVLRTLILGVDTPGYASLMVVVLLMGAINLITLGIFGEYLARVYTEVKGRPLYVVRDRIGFQDAPEQSAEQQQWTQQSTTGWRTSKTATGGSSRAAS
jgi:glycosyltransferase involved in cell wall biosynthesis